MRLNADATLTLAGPVPPTCDDCPPRIRLVPYLPVHVPTYHAWMEDADLRAATGSERLTLDEERAMQRAWQDDDDKLTFIILDGEALAVAEAAGVPRSEAAIQAMVGDVNLFFQADDDEGGGGAPGSKACAEVEIMVAAPAARRRGFGAAALRLMLAYARKHCGLQRVTAKIGRTNAASLALFARLGFAVVRDVPVFDERHVRLDLPAGEGVCAAVIAEGGWREEAYGVWVSGG